MSKHLPKYVKDHGSGEIIVLLHGFVSSSGYWNRLRRLLVKAKYRVVSIDLLGFGRAPKPRNGHYSYAEHIEHIRNILQTLGISGKFILIGHSMGALLAIRFANIYSASVRGLILLHPPIYSNTEQVRAILRSTGNFYRLLLDSGFRHGVWFILRSIRIVGKHNRHSRENSLKNVIERAELLADLQTVSVNTLLLVGSRDRKVYLKNLHDYRLRPNITLMVENVSHHSPRQQPNLVYDHIRSFLASQGAK